MKSTRSSRSSAEGYTLIELVVATFVGMILSGLCLSTVNSCRNLLGRDTVRTRLLQNMRGALEVLVADGRLAGENLGSGFPAIEVVDGASGASDTLIVRRNLIDEVLKLCTPVTQNSTVNQLFFAVPGTTAGCTYSGNTHNYQAWSSYRAAQGRPVTAYLYNSVSRTGQFFSLSRVRLDATHYWLETNPGPWAAAYPVESSSIYIIEQWSYALVGDLLQVTENDDTANPFNVSFGISDFQVAVLLQNGIRLTTFGRADPWTQIGRVEATLRGQDSYAGQTLDRAITAQFFPRNVLSN